MTKLRYGLLFGLGLIVAFLVASLQEVPGYMDADYYYYGAERLAAGKGFTEMVLWNYLDDPAGVPHPSHTYWMPLTSILAAFGLKFSGNIGGFNAAQIGFVIAAGLVPPLAAALSYTLTGRKNWAMLAGIVSTFSAFYLAYVTTTDIFGLFMLLGGVFYLVGQRGGRFRYLALGLLAGLMHLGRADGVLWLAAAGFLVAVENGDWRNILRGGTEAVLGYLVVMFPWYARNLGFYGSLFPPGGGQTLWLLEYDQLFSYPSSELTFSRWVESGWAEILQLRWWAFTQNIMTGIVVQGMILLGPLALLGAWRLKQERMLQAGGVVWFLLFLMMTVAFPFSGVRGGFFHSSAAFVPIIAALVPVGLDVVILWTVRVFKWEVRKIAPFLTGLLVLFVIFLSLFQISGQLIGLNGEPESVWDDQARRYQSIEARLDDIGADPGDMVMVVNPPGFSNASGRPAIAVPYDGADAVQAAAQRYGARFLLLEPDHPASLDDLYAFPDNLNNLVYLETFGGTHIFEINEVGP